MLKQYVQVPQGSVEKVKGKNGSTQVKLEWNPNFKPKYEAKFIRAQKFVDSEVLRLSEPFMPFDTGYLMKSGILGTAIGSGIVKWVAIYSKYLYYGKVMVGKPPKHPIDKNLVYQGGPQRGAFWFERMKSVHKKNILRGAKRLIGGR